MWEKLHKSDPVETGSSFWLHFFEQNPEILNEFEQFKPIGLAHLKGSPEFQKHSLHIYKSMDKAFKGEWAEVDKMSEIHRNLGKTDKEHYHAFRHSFMDWMQLNDEQRVHMDVWMEKFLHHMFSRHWIFRAMQSRRIICKNGVAIDAIFM